MAGTHRNRHTDGLTSADCFDFVLPSWTQNARHLSVSIHPPQIPFPKKTQFEWKVDLAECARIWKGGCIIRAGFLDRSVSYSLVYLVWRRSCWCCFVLLPLVFGSPDGCTHHHTTTSTTHAHTPHPHQPQQTTTTPTTPPPHPTLINHPNKTTPTNNNSKQHPRRLRAGRGPQEPPRRPGLRRGAQREAGGWVRRCEERGGEEGLLVEFCRSFFCVYVCFGVLC